MRGCLVAPTTRVPPRSTDRARRAGRSAASRRSRWCSTPSPRRSSSSSSRTADDRTRPSRAAVGLSEAAVRQRVQRLVRSGVLQIVAVTDPLQVGFSRQAMIGIRAEGNLEPVVSALTAMDEVDYVVVTAGSFDILVEVVCEDDDHLLAPAQRADPHHPRRPVDGVLRVPEAVQADLHLGHPLSPGPDRPRTTDLRTEHGSESESMSGAADHLWMHFTRMSSYDDHPVPTIERGEGAYIFDTARQASTSTACPACSWCRPGTGARNWPRPAPSRPASWPSSRSGPTPTRPRSSWPTGWRRRRRVT